MGFDIVGIEPKNKIGEYFRLNGQTWHTFWKLMLDITDMQQISWMGECNDMEKIQDELFFELRDKLKQALKDKGYVIVYNYFKNIKNENNFFMFYYYLIAFSTFMNYNEGFIIG